MSDTEKSGPVLIELDADTPAASPATAAPVPDLAALTPEPQGQAMQTIAAVAGRPPSRLVRVFWQSLVALVSFVASMAAYDFVMGLLARSPILGGIALGLVALFVTALLMIAGREWLAIGRLKRIDTVRADAQAAITGQDLKAARAVSGQLVAFYGGRSELELGLSEVRRHGAEQFDPEGALGLAEQHLLRPLDQAAQREVEAAARTVATVTAIVPIALADLAAALMSNMRMIRRIAEIYGGRSGTIGSWRLTRAVFSHLVATGAVAVGDDLIGSVAGGGILSKISRRFGEGLINGALTARVGVAAMEVCRPLPYLQEDPPSVTGIIKRALTGLFPGA